MLAIDMVFVSQNPGRPQCTIVLIMGTPIKVPLGNTHLNNAETWVPVCGKTRGAVRSEGGSTCSLGGFKEGSGFWVVGLLKNPEAATKQVLSLGFRVVGLLKTPLNHN